MRRVLPLLVMAALAAVGLTACMSDDSKESSSRQERRSAALVEAGAPTGGGYELVIDGLTPLGKAIQTLSFSWGVTTPASASTGTATGKVTFKNLDFVKKLDETSPLLFKGAATGTIYKAATLKLYVAPAGKPLNYATYELGNVIISEVQHAGNADDVPTEQVSLAYRTIKTSVAPLAAEGSLGGVVTFGWNIVAAGPY